MSDERILVVEDENIVAIDLKRRLTKLGYNVVGMASNAVRALKLVEECKPALVLMDIHIQGQTDGIEIAQIIYEKFQTPVIFLTAYCEDATLARARDSKPYGYLLKPYSEREMHACIQMALEKSDADSRTREARMHLQLALEAGNLSTWESTSQSDDVILSYTTSGRLANKSDWKSLARQIVPEDREKVFSRIETIKQKPQLNIEVTFEVLDPQLGHRWLAMFGKSHLVNDCIKVVGVLQDITERHIVEQNLKQAAMVYRCSADGIAILDESKQVLSVNSAFSRITGFDIDAMAGKSLGFINPPTLSAERTQEMNESIRRNGYWQGEVKTYRANHQPLYSLINIGALPDPIHSLGHYVVVISDFTEIRETQEKLSRIAYYDALTNLPNRNLFMDRLDLAIAKAKRDTQPLGILFLDMDQFKRVNDTLGHQVGDSMLRAVAQRLKRVIREVDTLCRIGGDEFIIIIERFNSRQDLKMIANKLLDSLKSPLLLGNTEVIPHASIGISIFPSDSDDRDDLIKMADTAMYAAKNSGRNRYLFYKVEMTSKAEHYLLREHELRRALEENELRVHYQLQVNTDTRRIVGLEALIRWQHPARGLLSALEIIPVAETSDLIIAIGAYVVDEVCRQCREWHDEGIYPGRIAMNVSPRQLEDGQFVSMVAQAVERHGISAPILEVEITESCLQDNEAILRALLELEKLGITVSIDDFGTGYSCLSSLKTLPIHRLKIDRAFVREIPDDESDCAIASAIVALAKKLKLQVVAEGIETPSQAAFMQEIGCDELQGFLFSRALPADEIIELIKNQPTKVQEA